MNTHHDINEMLSTQADLLPAVLAEELTSQLQGFADQVPDGLLALLDADRIAELCRVWSVSRFATQLCKREPQVLQGLMDSGDLERSYEADTLALSLAQDCAELVDSKALHEVLRQRRQREMLRILWRDVTGKADLQETLRDLSALADASIQQAVRFLQVRLEQQLGTPIDADGESMSLVVLAMGKLGAGELNYSSDIDLIFCYAEEGETQGAERSTSHAQFFTRLGRQVISALGDVEADGFVFRVDMRLRPFGDSGPLAMCMDGFENYYQTHGREWERYAMIKARVVTGRASDRQAVEDILRPFVYRRYLDYGAYDALRDMKGMINKEVTRKSMQDNVKLGPGGIREIEFIGQAFQLIRGGREKDLQIRPILQVLKRLVDAEHLPAYVVSELTEAYVFLRTVEHRIQQFEDQQTHQLPNDALARLRIAYGMNFDSWQAFAAVLNRHRRRVDGHFAQVFGAPQLEQEAQPAHQFTDIWRRALDDDKALHYLDQQGFTDSQTSYSLLAALRQSSAYRALSAGGRKRLDQLMPLLLAAVAQGKTPDTTLQRVIHLIETIARRTSYLALLAENPMALSQLVKLCRASPWLAQVLARHPLLLDELLDPRTLYTPPSREELEADLTQRLISVPVDDLEQQMEVLRQFKQANVMRVAAADIADAVPLMVVSDHLTWIAEICLKEVLAMAWQHMTQRHGLPPAAPEGQVGGGFAIIAYGKLGGIELGYGSDLDLVFIYDGEQDAMTTGDKPIAQSVFYARLGQRAIHILTAHTPGGVLYEVDMRLRPSGASGMLVSQLQSFRDYQLTKAWTWEHQALVRARPVAGDVGLVERFIALRRDILGQPRDLQALSLAVQEMRDKMRTTLDKSSATQWDIKQGAGGIVDIEFMVQYLALAHAANSPVLLDYTDNIRILERAISAELLSADEGEQLAESYRQYRKRVHRLKLQDMPAHGAEPLFTEQRELVTRLWTRILTNET